MCAAPTIEKRRNPIRSWLPAKPSLAFFAASSADADLDYGDVAYYHGNLLVNPEGTWAYYVLGEVDWDNRPVGEHEGVIAAQSHRYAELVARTVRTFALPLEFPAAEFEARMIAEYPNPPAPLGGGASDFRDQLDRKVEYTRALGARTLVPVIAVLVTSQRMKREHLPLIADEDRAIGAPLGVVADVRAQVARITRAVSRPGWSGKPVTTDGLTWVLRSSSGPGFPAPSVRLDRWAAVDDMHGFSDPVTAEAEEGSPYTRLRGVRGGNVITRYVTVLRVDSTPKVIDTTVREPWLAWFDSLGPEDIDPEQAWRVQWASTLTIIPGKEAARDLAWHGRLIGKVAAHYAENDADEDPYMGELRDHATQAVSQAMNGRAHESARAHGQMFVIVSAASPDVLQSAVETVTDLALAEQDIVLTMQLGQWADYRRSIAGNVWKQSGHVLHVPVTYLAAGVPNVSPQAGDPTGFPCGNPAGSNTVHVFNGLHGRRNGKAGVGVLAGAQGSGKTATAVAIVDDMCQSGVPGVAFTPDAQIAQILNARHYQAGRGRVIPLTQVTTPGIAMPSLMVPVPIRDKDESEDHYQGRVDAACAARIRYERDWLTSVLPGDMQRGGYGVSAAIENAVSKSEGEYGVSPWVHVANLRKDTTSDVAAAVADALETRSVMPTGRLGFPRRGDDSDKVIANIRSLLESDALFTAITIPGVELAKTPDKQNWRDEHFDAEPVLMAGLRLSSLALFSDQRPGWYIADEVDIATGGATAFTPFLRQLIYDLRRFDKFAALLVKSMSTVRGLDQDVTALLGWAGVGRMGAEGAASCMPLLGAADTLDPGIVHDIPYLEDGEWFFRGWDNKVRRIPFDQSWWHPDVVAGTDTKHGHRPERLEATIRSW